MLVQKLPRAPQNISYILYPMLLPPRGPLSSHGPQEHGVLEPVVAVLPGLLLLPASVETMLQHFFVSKPCGLRSRVHESCCHVRVFILSNGTWLVCYRRIGAGEHLCIYGGRYRALRRWQREPRRSA